MIARASVVLPEDVPPETRMFSFSVTARRMRFARSPASASPRSSPRRSSRRLSTSTSPSMRKLTSPRSRMRETYLRIETETPASIAGGTMTCTRIDWPKTWTRPETMGWSFPSRFPLSPARWPPSALRRAAGIAPVPPLHVPLVGVLDPDALVGVDDDLVDALVDEERAQRQQALFGVAGGAGGTAGAGEAGHVVHSTRSRLTNTVM